MVVVAVYSFEKATCFLVVIRLISLLDGDNVEDGPSDHSVFLLLLFSLVRAFRRIVCLFVVDLAGTDLTVEDNNEDVLDKEVLAAGFSGDIDLVKEWTLWSGTRGCSDLVADIDAEVDVDVAVLEILDTTTVGMAAEDNVVVFVKIATAVVGFSNDTEGISSNVVDGGVAISMAAFEVGDFVVVVVDEICAGVGDDKSNILAVDVVTPN